MRLAVIIYFIDCDPMRSSNPFRWRPWIRDISFREPFGETILFMLCLAVMLRLCMYMFMLCLYQVYVCVYIIVGYVCSMIILWFTRYV